MGSRRIMGLSWVLALFGFRTGKRLALPELPGVQGTLEVDPGAFDRIIAISDVHGMADALRTLLITGQVINERGEWNAAKTLLLVIGDSIDKGEQSVAVVDLWIGLRKSAKPAGGRILHLLGNHEAEFLADPTRGRKAESFRQELRRKGIPLAEFTDAATERGRFLREMPVAVKIGNWLFCHSGLFPDLSWKEFSLRASGVLSQGDYGNLLLQASDSIVQAKRWWKPEMRAQGLERLTRAGFHGVVFGHQPAALDIEGTCAISAEGRLIKIDNGMYPGAGAHAGSLLIFPKPAQLATATPEVLTFNPLASALGPLPVVP